MTPLILIAADLAAISILTFALYLRRHRRRDLVVSYLGMNVGVMAVAAALSGSAAGVGLGLGLFGVLSIIRLRSTELAQHEVAYYFSALALGLIAGLGIDPVWLPLALMAMILLVMFVGDHSRVLPAYRHQTVILDRAIAVDEELHARLEEVVHGKVHSATVQELDLVNDKTIVDVRYAYVPAAFPGGAAAGVPAARIPTLEPAATYPATFPASNHPAVAHPAAGDAPAVPAGRCGMTARAHAGILGALRLLPPIGLDALNAEAALQTRVDRKYVVPEAQAQELLATFTADVRVLEMDRCRCFAYDSVYFDTAGLDSYLLAARGRRRRYKVRTRTYVDSAVSFLEVKTEGAREATVKERIPYELTDRARLTAEGLDYIRETLTAAVGGVPSGPLGPVLETRYHRTTLYLPESGSRATIDTDVTWQRPGGKAWVLDGAVVLETKSGSAAGPLDRHLWTHGVRPSRISKFATGMAALCPELPANRWNRTLRRSLVLRPAA